MFVKDLRVFIIKFSVKREERKKIKVRQFLPTVIKRKLQIMERNLSGAQYETLYCGKVKKNGRKKFN